MDKTLAYRIKKFRLQKGYSQGKVSELVGKGLSVQDVDAMEKGDFDPDEAVMEKLADIFEVESISVTKKISIPIGDIRILQKTSLPEEQLNEIKLEIAFSLESYLELESRLQISSQFENPISEKATWAQEDVEEAVNVVRKAWKLGEQPVFNLVDLLEAQRIKVFELDDFPIPLNALAALAMNHYPVIAIRSELSNLEKRVALLRALAYILFGSDCAVISGFADYFAHAFLMPKHLFVKEIGQTRKNISIQELIKLKEYYGISMKGIMERAGALNIVPLEVRKRFNVFLASNPERSDEIGLGNFYGREGSGRFKQLLYKAVAENVVPIQEAAALAGVSPHQLKKDLQSIF